MYVTLMVMNSINVFVHILTFIEVRESHCLQLIMGDEYSFLS